MQKARDAFGPEKLQAIRDNVINDPIVLEQRELLLGETALELLLTSDPGFLLSSPDFAGIVSYLETQVANVGPTLPKEDCERLGKAIGILKEIQLGTKTLNDVKHRNLRKTLVKALSIR